MAFARLFARDPWQLALAQSPPRLSDRRKQARSSLQDRALGLVLHYPADNVCKVRGAGGTSRPRLAARLHVGSRLEYETPAARCRGVRKARVVAGARTSVAGTRAATDSRFPAALFLRICPPCPAVRRQRRQHEQSLVLRRTQSVESRRRMLPTVAR